MNWLKTIGWTLKYGTFVSSFGFIVTVSIQVFSRYFLENVPAWTEETSRILFIYAIAFASGLAFKGNYFVKLDLFQKKESPQFEITLNILSLLVSLFLFGTMSFYSINVLKMGLNELSPSLQIPMIIPFFGLQIMSLSICLYAFIRLLKLFKTNNK